MNRIPLIGNQNLQIQLISLKVNLISVQNKRFAYRKTSDFELTLVSAKPNFNKARDRRFWEAMGGKLRA